MLAEAVARHGLDRTGLAHRLQRHRQLIATLKEPAKVTVLVRALAIHVEPVTLTNTRAGYYRIIQLSVVDQRRVDCRHNGTPRLKSSDIERREL